ncbi:TAXI family TRAP transporter solute-binding subunit [Saliniramus sp.]|uniref:TAXI family TRAP transporter solute-binding subunit n=1 Tax=Saliniramus sp. TaxID=2986772 RepID=UPI002BC507BA|nr:TAXI family TRAP transporter solute-binding subunit [Saliniramus sp.]HMB11985.1 TAXI family TRAP transporter solute-binding subunit [Saliniramus sp.]
MIRHFSQITRAAGVFSLGAAFLVGTPVLRAQAAPELEFHSGSAGGSFLPYAQAASQVITESGVASVEAVESGGSNANLAAIEESDTVLATVFLGSANAAANGTGAFDGTPTMNTRALFPMYMTSFQIAARVDAGIGAFMDLDGRRVGAGPAGGPAENYLTALAEVVGISPVIVNASSAEHVDQMVAGEIEALWQGASVPVPAIVASAEQTDAIVFGLTDDEIEAMLDLFPFMAPTEVAPGVYPGQSDPIHSVAAWNFVMTSSEMSDELAYQITSAVLSRDDLEEVLPLLALTRAENAVSNRIIQFHPGAIRYYEEVGVALP